MQIIKEKGFAADKEVDIVINSANGYLIPDSSGAGRIRELSDELTHEEKAEFDYYFSELPQKIKELYLEKQKNGGWESKKANLSCLRLLLQNQKSFHPGQALCDFDSLDKPVIHAITMTYDPETGDRIKGTVLSVMVAMESAIKMAIEKGATSVSLPIPCARAGYGISPKDSLTAVMSALRGFEDYDIDHSTPFVVILCFDNENTAKLLNEK
jgi:O-acetyl-ADP-ribose deacetylase (regulator of RNase III)